jgi:hypothetical protein
LSWKTFWSDIKEK